MNRKFYLEDIQIINRHMKKMLSIISHREIQTQIRMKTHIMAITKKNQIIINVVKDVEKS